MKDNHLHADSHGGKSKGTESLGTGIIGLCEHTDMVRGTTLRSSGSAANALRSRVISPCPNFIDFELDLKKK